MVRDMDGIVRFWNSGAEELYGWSREEVLGKNVHETLRTVPYASNGNGEYAVLADGRWEGNLVQYTRDGQEIVVASRAGSEDGSRRRRPGAILEINRDITSTLQAEEALRKAERLAAMGRVAGIIAHEINNPLEAIINAFYLLRNHPSLDEHARTYARLGEEELLRLAHIVRQTLGFYRESQQPSAVSIPEVLNNVLELQSRHLQVNGIEVERIYRDEAMVFGFPLELKQVFLNLIGNAVQAMAAERRPLCDCASKSAGTTPPSREALRFAFPTRDLASGLKMPSVSSSHSSAPSQPKGPDLDCGSVRASFRNTTVEFTFAVCKHRKSVLPASEVFIPEKVSAKVLKATPGAFQ